MPKRGKVVRKDVGKRCSSTTAILCVGATLLFCWLTEAPLFAEDDNRAGRHSKLSSDLDDVAPEDAVDVIVQFRDVSEEKHFKKVRGLGARQKAVLHVIDADSFAVPATSLSQLADDPEVKYVSPDRPLTASFDAEPSSDFASVAWSFGWTGEGIGIAVLDSGVNPHPDLAEFGSTRSRIVYNESFLEGEPSAADEFGHGTYIAGVIAGNGQSSFRSRTRHRGVAERAAIINLRILDKNGIGRDSAAIAAIERAIELKDIYNIRIINLSIGRPVFESYKSDPLCQAVEAAWRAGIVVVIAAGNFGRNFVPGTEGYGSITAPGNHPFAITVGATDTQGSRRLTDDTVTRFSSKGPTLVDHIAKPDLVAPGTKNSGGDDEGDDEDQARRGGTSTSAAVVSGAVALLLQQDPQLSPDQLKARLMKSAFKEAGRRQEGRRYDAFRVGAGYLDIPAALLEREWSPAEVGYARSPEVAHDANSGSVYFVRDDSMLWGSSSTWAATNIWGDTRVATSMGNTILLGNSVVWGPTRSPGFSFIWSDNIEWEGSTLNSHDGGAPLPTCYPRLCGR